MIKKSFCKHFQIIRKVILFILPTYHSKLHETISSEVLQTVCECLMVLLRKGSFSSNSCPSAVRAFSVLHPVCVLVRVLLVFDVRVLRFCLSLRFTRRRAAFYLRGRHREVNSTILTVAILMQGQLPPIHQDWPGAGQEEKLFGGLLFWRGQEMP